MNALEYAHQYADQNWPVFPVHSIIHGGKCSCSKCKCKYPGKHPRTKKGFKDSTVDKTQIERWWIAKPESNIGIQTGQSSGIFVIDVDPKNGGLESFEKLQQKTGNLEDHTLVAETGGGGFHLYFQHPGKKVRCRTNGLGSGIDIKGDGGYVVAAPSNHISGGIYHWRDQIYQPPQAPDELLELLSQNPARNGYSGADVILQGQRNSTLLSIAGKLRSEGKNEAQIEFELQQTNVARCNPPLENQEVSSLTQKICKYPPGTSLKPMRDYWIDLIMSDSGPSKYQVRFVLMALSRFMDDHGGNCSPSQSLLCQITGYGSRRMISTNLKLAEQDGWIRSFKVGSNSGQGWYYGYIATIPPILAHPLNINNKYI